MTYQFNPKPDITAYELALLWTKHAAKKPGKVKGFKATDYSYEKVMPESLKRHFERIEE